MKFFKNNVCKRVLSMLMAFLMFFTMFAAQLPSGILEVKAATTVASPEVNGNNVTFRYASDSATSVNLAGTMNGWNTTATPMIKGEDGVWTYSTTMNTGVYQYKYVVDGSNWVTDPNNTNGQYGGNSVVAVGTEIATKVDGTSVTFRYYGPDETSVNLAGTMNSWSTTETAMVKDAYGVWSYTTTLAAGEYQYKYVVNGTDWITDPNNTNYSSDGNSVITIVDENTPEVPAETYDVTLHVYNVDGWDALSMYTWSPEIAGWPGVQIAAEAGEVTWYDYTLEDMAAGAVNFNINNNDNGLQTGDLTFTVAADATEFWIVAGDRYGINPGAVFTSEKDVVINTTTYDVTLHVYNADGWDAISMYTWEPEIAGWPGKQIATGTVAGQWYDYTLEDMAPGAVNFNINNNDNGLQTGDLTFTVAEDATEFWIVAGDKAGINPGAVFTSEEDVVINTPSAEKYDVKLHVYNVDGWESISMYTWSPEIAGWPGVQIATGTVAGQWYEYTIEDMSAGAVNFNINNSDNGLQTGDLTFTVAEDATEFWIVAGNKGGLNPGAVFTSEEDVVINSAEDATEYKVTVHYYNENGWDAVYAYGGEGDNWTAIPDSGIGTWPGKVLTENETHAGWYDLELTKYNTDKLMCIFNDNGSNQTVDIEVAITGEEVECWYTSEGLSYSKPASWFEEGEVLVHFYNVDKWSNVSIWAWNTADDTANYTGGTWPGYAMTANAAKDGWYDIILTGVTADGLSFLMSNAGAGAQTGDMAVMLSDDVKEIWAIGGDRNGDYPGTAYTKAPELWTNPDAGLGKEEANSIYYVKDAMEVKIGDDVYPMSVYLNGVFEANVTLAAGTYSATLIENGETTDKTASITVAAEADVYFRLNGETFTAAEVAPAAIVGSLTDLGYASWDPASTAEELTYLGGGIYQGTLKFTALAADTTIEYKVAFNDGWDWSIGKDGGSDNISVTIPAGSTSFTVLVDAVNNVIYDDVTTADFLVNGSSKNPFTTTISLIGTVREAGDNDWSTNITGYEFTPISDTLYRFDKTFENAGTYTYKAVFDYGTWYEKEGDQTIKTTENDTHVVFLYDTVSGYLYDTVNEETKVASLLSMKVRPAVMEVSTNDNGTVTFVAAAEAGQKVTLYYGNKADVEANGTDALTEVTMSAVSNGKSSSGELWLGDAALDLVYYYDIDGTRTLDGSNPTVTVGDAEYSNYTRAAYTGRVVNVPGTLPGPSWDAASNVMTYAGNRIYTYTFKDVPAAKYEYKIAIDGGWGENYGKNGVPGGDNISVSVPTKQDVTIYYSDVTHYAVNSIDYIFATITLSGTGIPEGTKLTDDGLTGIYSVTITLPAGTYSDLVIDCDGTKYEVAEFTLNEEKEVTFCMDPVTGIFYHNASDVAIKEDAIYFDSKDSEYKSVYGAVATGEEVTFALTTGNDITYAKLLIKGNENKVVDMIAEQGAEASLEWSATVSLDTIGEYTYYFAVSNGSSVKVYGDDDGYYGTGKVDELTTVQPYDLVVYKSGFETPDWMKNAVIYQIFPDRFYDADVSNNMAQTTARGDVDYEYITDWYTLPENPEQEDRLDEATYKATGAYYGDREWSNEIYGGDLDGITERIDYLKALGVTVIYLNPVFSSISNHRYDACDYTEIDPILGTEGDFAELVAIAEKNGMKVVLDGVFNHVSDDSIYFDRYYKFIDDGLDTIGAYPYWAYVYDYMAANSADQETAEAAAKAYFTETYGITDYSYTEWFDVFTTTLKDDTGAEVYDTIGQRTDKPVYGYDGWWGYDSMPIIKSTNGSEYQTGDWAEEIIYNEEGTSVTQYWITQGMDGWRLDVANEVSDETWQRFRESVKALNNGEAVIIGEIWDDATKYILGDMYDSVMNYMFRNAVTAFAMGTDAQTTTKEMERLRERYPEEAFYAMMNLVGSHDTTRILSYLDGIGDDRADKSIAAAFPTYETTSDTAKERQHLVAFLQFTYAGAPTIYYGDEIGMVGSDDPDDRRAFEWGEGSEELVKYYATLAAVRSKYTALRTGSVETFETGSNNVLGYVRRDSKNQVIVLANNSNEAVEITLDLTDLDVNADKLVNVLDKTKYAVTAKSATVSVPAYRGLILVDDNKVVTVKLNEKALAPAYDSSYTIADREYDIVYHLGGGKNAAENPATYVAGSGVEFTLAAPTSEKAGYIFAGWYTDATYKKAFEGIKVDTEGIVEVYAKWIPCTYQVVFDDGNGKPVAQTFTYGVSQALKANSFKKTGYVFAGWALTVDAKEAAFANKQVVDDTVLGIQAQNDNDLKVTLYPVWKNEYTVTFNTQGGKLDGDTTVKYEYKVGISKLPTPEKEGYIFGGWYRDEAGKKKVASITKSMAEDLTLYAKWTPCNYTIKFDANAATFTTTKATGSMKNLAMKYDAQATLRANAFVLKGYEFVGWALTATPSETDVIYTNEAVVSNLTSVNKGTVTLYAQWVATDYDITYETNGGVMPNEYYEHYVYGNEYVLPVPTKDGYTFAGWYRDAKLKKAVSKNSAKESILTKNDFGDVTLYAKWTGNKYDVVYDADAADATGKTATQKNRVYGTGKALTNNGYKRTGYTFIGWSLTPESQATAEELANPSLRVDYTNKEKVATLGNAYQASVTLYAVWDNKFTVTFNGNGGTFAETGTTVAGEYIYTEGLTELPTPVRDGYTFAGWYTDAKCKKAVSYNKTTKKYLAGTKDYGDIELYAKWTGNKYDVVFDADVADATEVTGKTATQKNRVYGTAKALTKNGFKRAGYVFIGWSLTPESQATTNNPSDRVDFANAEKVAELGSYQSTVTLYAVWDNAFVATFNANGGTFADDSAAMALPYMYTEGFVELPTPERDGYEFKGWYTDAKCKKAVSYNKATKKYLAAATDSGDMELYAKWTGKKYDVVFDADADGVKGKTATQKNRVYGTAKALTKNGYKLAGYNFLGWSLTPVSEATAEELANPSLRVDYANGAKVDTLGAYAEDVTLYAVWEVIEYTITYKNVEFLGDAEALEAAGYVTSYTADDKVVLKQPERIGYTFMGWYTDKNCKKKAADIKVGTTGDKVFYAKWVLNK